MIIDRRALIKRIGLSLMAAPAIVRYSSLMPVKKVINIPKYTTIDCYQWSQWLSDDEQKHREDYYKYVLNLLRGITEEIVKYHIGRNQEYLQAVNRLTRNGIPWYEPAGLTRGIISNTQA